MNSSQILSLAALALLAAVVGCGTPAALFGKKAEPTNPLSEHPLLADNRSVFAKGYDRVAAAMSSAFGQDEKPPAAPVQKKNDATSLATASKPGPSFWVTLAQTAERAGNQASATAYYQRALQVDSSHLEALLGYARMHDRQGDFPEALRRYEEAVRRHPKSATAHNDFALCLMRKGDAPRAVSLLSKAVELEPGKPLYRNNISTILVQMGRGQEAWRHLAAVHPPAVAHYNLGFLLSQQGQLPAAREQFAKALQQDPNLVAARQSLQAIDQRMGSMAQAPLARPQQGNPRYAGPGGK